VSDDEFQRLEQMAKRVGMSVPMFCKKKAQGIKMKEPNIDREGAFQIASELRRIGVNVNQIAKHTNRGEKALEGQINGLQEQLHNLWRSFNSAIER